MCMARFKCQNDGTGPVIRDKSKRTSEEMFKRSR